MNIFELPLKSLMNVDQESLIHLLNQEEYYKLQQILQDIELQAYSTLSTFDPWYQCFLAGIYCILKEFSSCRFLVKRNTIADPDFKVWSQIASCLASFQFKKIYILLQHNWNHEINQILSQHFRKSLLKSEFKKLSKVYSSIDPAKASDTLGIPVENIGNFGRENSWDIDAGAGTFTY